MSSAASRGVLLGACAGLLLGLNDFGAMWLWLDMASDRWVLLNRVLGLLVPIGALVGAVSAVAVLAVAHVLARIAPARAASYALADAVTLWLSPALVMLAWALFSGGSASRVAGVALWKPATAALLIACAWVGTHLLGLVIRACESARRARILAAMLLVSAQLLIKLNQWVLPNLYDYLHGALALACFALLSVGLGVLASSAQRLRHATASPALGAALLLLSSLWGAHHVRALSSNQNVAVAMLDARACHTRALMLIATPWLPREHPPARPHRPSPRVDPSQSSIARIAPTHSAGAHVLLITIDALRADHLGTYGYKRPTSPKLDALAAESLVFERAYAQAPHSSYSLSSLMTSEYLHETLDLGAPPPNATLATTLAAAGYHTAAFYTLGIFHTAAERLGLYEKTAFGFALHDHQDREPEALTDRVLSEIDRALAQGEPNTLIWAHYFNVHEPYRATTFGTTDIDRYDSEIARADAAVERLVREAKRRFKRDVITIITADHGEEFREHGGVYHGSTLYEEQVRVPLIIHGTGMTPQRFAAPVELLDVAPTVLGFVDVGRAASMRGDDLRGFLERPSAAPPAFSAVIHKRMVVKWPHKLIADLRFGLFELYALDQDPTERRNLASKDPALLSTLRDEVYGWLDSLALDDNPPDDPRVLAIDQGRLGDRRAVPSLVALIQDESADTAMRREAGAILGKLADPKSTEGLLAALSAKQPLVAAEAAIALGRMHHTGGRDLLRNLVLSEDPDIRSRAAVSLGRLRDVAAVPALIDALWIAPNDYEREEAIRWLGRLRDPRAIEPLISLLPESRTRHLVVIALGAIGDPRGFDTLRDVLQWEDHANVRDSTVRALGMLKDPRGLSLLLPLAVSDPTLKHATESLVRLGAIEQGAIGGIDFDKRTRAPGVTRCTEFSDRHDWDYLHRTVCETSRAQVTLHMSLPSTVVQSAGGSVWVMAMRRVDGQEPATVSVQIGQQPAQQVPVDSAWTEARWNVDAGSLSEGRTRVQLNVMPESARLALDHVLVLPR